MSSPCVEVVGAQRKERHLLREGRADLRPVQIDARSERRAGIAGAVPADLMIAGIEPAGNQGAHEASVHGVDAERHRLGRGAGHAQPDHGGRIEGIRPVLPERGARLRRRIRGGNRRWIGRREHRERGHAGVPVVVVEHGPGHPRRREGAGSARDAPGRPTRSARSRSRRRRRDPQIAGSTAPRPRSRSGIRSPGTRRSGRHGGAGLRRRRSAPPATRRRPGRRPQARPRSPCRSRPRPSPGWRPTRRTRARSRRRRR